MLDPDRPGAESSLGDAVLIVLVTAPAIASAPSVESTPIADRSQQLLGLDRVSPALPNGKIVPVVDSRASPRGDGGVAARRESRGSPTPVENLPSGDSAVERTHDGRLEPTSVLRLVNLHEG